MQTIAHNADVSARRAAIVAHTEQQAALLHTRQAISTTTTTAPVLPVATTETSMQAQGQASTPISDRVAISATLTASRAVDAAKVEQVV